MSTPPPATPAPARRLGDAFLTIVLAVIAIIVAIVLVAGAALWGAGENTDSSGVLLGMLGPIVITMAGVIVAVIRAVRNRRAWFVPLLTIALSVLVWWLASLVAFA